MITLEQLREWLLQSAIWLQEAMDKGNSQDVARLLGYRSMLKDMIIEELSVSSDKRVA